MWCDAWKNDVDIFISEEFKVEILLFFDGLLELEVVSQKLPATLHEELLGDCPVISHGHLVVGLKVEILFGIDHTLSDQDLDLVDKQVDGEASDLSQVHEETFDSLLVTESRRK